MYKIMVIEDDPAIREELEVLLKNALYEPVCPQSFEVSCRADSAGIAGSGAAGCESSGGKRNSGLQEAAKYFRRAGDFRHQQEHFHGRTGMYHRRR